MTLIYERKQQPIYQEAQDTNQQGLRGYTHSAMWPDENENILLKIELFAAGFEKYWVVKPTDQNLGKVSLAGWY